MPRHERKPNDAHDFEPSIFKNVTRFSLAHRIDNSPPSFLKRPQVALQRETQNSMHKKRGYAQKRISVHMVIDNQGAAGFYGIPQSFKERSPEL